eukprot:382994-Alexandrium_andersonii.AAC.1
MGGEKRKVRVGINVPRDGRGTVHGGGDPLADIWVLEGLKIADCPLARVKCVVPASFQNDGGTCGHVVQPLEG